MDFELLEILPGNRAVVSTEGLYRVIDRRDGDVLGELMSKEEADIFVDFYGKDALGDCAEALDYQQVRERSAVVA